jgi:hypothetical protein
MISVLADIHVYPLMKQKICSYDGILFGFKKGMKHYIDYSMGKP